MFVEVDKNTTGTSCCIYRPPWANLSEYNSCMTNILAVLQSENKYGILLGDYNVDISPAAKIKLATEKLKNILSSGHFFPLINKPTCESKHSFNIIDTIYCNIPNPLEMCDVLRPYISDHNVILCVLYETTEKMEKKHYKI